MLMEETKIVVLADAYSIADATQKMRSHISWLYWIAGLSLANLVYILLDQGYFMVAGLGLNSFAADWFSATEEQVVSFKITLGVLLGLFFVVSGYLALKRAMVIPVVIATTVYALDGILFATIYFDIMSLLFHLWATLSLVQGVMFMIQLKKHAQGISPVEEISA
jgi:hypothetical protein